MSLHGAKTVKVKKRRMPDENHGEDRSPPAVLYRLMNGSASRVKGLTCFRENGHVFSGKWHVVWRKAIRVFESEKCVDKAYLRRLLIM